MGEKHKYEEDETLRCSLAEASVGEIHTHRALGALRGEEIIN